jgi:hypothetical protein
MKVGGKVGRALVAELAIFFEGFGDDAIDFAGGGGVCGV